MKKTTLLASVLLSSSLLQGSFLKGDAGSLDIKVGAEAAMSTSNPWFAETDGLAALSVGAKIDYLSPTFLIPQLSMGASLLVSQPVLSDDNSAAIFGQAKDDGKNNPSSEGVVNLSQLYFKFTNSNYRATCRLLEKRPILLLM